MFCQSFAALCDLIDIAKIDKVILFCNRFYLSGDRQIAICPATLPKKKRKNNLDGSGFSPLYVYAFNQLTHKENAPPVKEAHGYIIIFLIIQQ